MLDTVIRTNVKDQLFNNSHKRVLTKTEKALVREQLDKDVAAWLAEGNEIDDRGLAVNDTRHRPVRVSSPGHFE